MRRPEPEPVRAGEESAWDYPRPPRVEPVSQRITIRLGGVLIADTVDAVRVLETSHPPVYYLPADSFLEGALVPTEGSSFCEFKGGAAYFDVHGGSRIVSRAAWTYPQPARGFESLRGRVAVYAGEMDACTVGDEQVTPQPGRFYGGWITSRIRGPFKGEPGSMGW
ncbi:DUF427 domain-containing protein [Microbacterium sp. Re1]|uniref:DUF427 domain-containing protein n=1 Tax=Microbacterium commune TaxID=2762219 RepID=A0ABR8W489_9MICO|nr:DUF427 domain-containing protein [Microbacterium commune]MBD8011822.1 DUF427 domain-containing protein [Microbacterium commune]